MITRLICCSSLALAGLFARTAGASDSPKPESAPVADSVPSAKVAFDVKFITVTKRDWNHSTLKAMCQGSGSGYAVLGPQKQGVVLKQLLGKSGTKTVSYPTMTCGYDRDCTIKSLVSIPYGLPPSNADTAKVGTEIHVKVTPTEHDQVHCRWNVTMATLLGYAADSSPILSSALHGADTNLHWGESIAVPCETKAATETTIMILTPKQPQQVLAAQ
jgi:hypothetical protein